MQTDQFAEFVAAVVQSLPRDLDTNTAQDWITNREALAKHLRYALVPPQLKSLFTPVDTFEVQLPEVFVPSDHFVVGFDRKEAPIKISFIGESFERLFLRLKWQENSPRKVISSPDRRKVTFLCQTLNRRSDNKSIIAALGGEGYVQSTLAEVYAVMAEQLNGKNTNNCLKQFFVRNDFDGVLHKVWVCKHTYGWRIEACDAKLSTVLDAGCQVFIPAP